MLPVSTTHALALARTEELERRASRTPLREPATPHTRWAASALSALTRPLHREAAARGAHSSPAACCA